MENECKKQEKLLTYREAGKLLGVMPSTIHHYVHKGYLKLSSKCVMQSGIPMSEVIKFKKSPPTFKPISRDIKKQIVKEYQAGGQTMIKIAKKYGISESLVSKLVKGTR